MQTPVTRERLEEVRRFLKHMQALNRVSQPEKQKAIASAVVTLGDAAAMCNMGARELWVNHVSSGILRMYDGNVPAAEFLRVTHLLQDVIAFFCERERIRRYHHSSYQELVKDILEYGSRSDDNAKQAMLSLSSYFNMSRAEAITFESMTAILSRYFEFYPTGGATSLQANINNTNSVNNGLVQAVKDLVAAMSHTSSAGQGSPSDNGVQGETEPQQHIPNSVSEEYRRVIKEKGHNSPHGKKISAYLYAAQGMSNEDIAKNLGYNASNITKHINDGRDLALAPDIHLPSLVEYMPDARKKRRQ